MHSRAVAYSCIDQAKDGEEKHREEFAKGDEQEPTDLGQPTDIEDIKSAEVTQDKEELIQLLSFEGIIMNIKGKWISFHLISNGK